MSLNFLLIAPVWNRNSCIFHQIGCRQGYSTASNRTSLESKLIQHVLSEASPAYLKPSNRTSLESKQ